MGHGNCLGMAVSRWLGLHSFTIFDCQSRDSGIIYLVYENISPGVLAFCHLLIKSKLNSRRIFLFKSACNWLFVLLLYGLCMGCWVMLGCWVMGWRRRKEGMIEESGR